MEIKPTGPGGLLPPDSGNGQTTKKFSAAERPAEAAGTDAGQPFRSITAELRLSDLQVPAKLDQTISRCSEELLLSALQGTGSKVSPDGTAQLTEFLSNDPVIRGKLINYLERVLT